MSGVRTFAWLVAVVIGALAVAVVALDVGTGGTAVDWTDGAYVFAALSSAAVGLVLALRRPGNPIGWVLLTNAVLLLLSGLAEATRTMRSTATAPLRVSAWRRGGSRGAGRRSSRLWSPLP